jgi:hypothetical protein
MSRIAPPEPASGPTRAGIGWVAPSLALAEAARLRTVASSVSSVKPIRDNVRCRPRRGTKSSAGLVIEDRDVAEQVIRLTGVVVKIDAVHAVDQRQRCLVCRPPGRRMLRRRRQPCTVREVFDAYRLLPGPLIQARRDGVTRADPLNALVTQAYLDHHS